MSMQNYHFTSNSIATVSHPLGHVKQTLPPSLVGIDDAWIRYILTISLLICRYFVKVTVNRPSMFSRNLRQIVPFVFCPVEPPRPPQTNQIFVRKRLTLAQPVQTVADSSPGFWSGLFRKAPSIMPSGIVAFEARLPHPAILVPAEAIPVTLFLKRDGDSRGIVYIRSIKVMLGITTYIAAQGFRRELGYVRPILDVGNLNLTLPANQNEVVINPADLVQQGSSSKGFILPDTIPPSFRTCNIARKYTLVLQMGVSSIPQANPEIIQLTIDVQVFSGFKPPPQLIPTVGNPPPDPPPTQDGKMEDPPTAELPTYDEAVAETLGGPVVPTDDTGRRGRFEVDARHLEGAESWDDEKK